MALRASPQLSSTGGRSLAEYATPRLPKKRGGVWGVCVPQVRNTHLSRPHCTRHPMQILREHIMVRVGGGWDTLEHYLDKHDPCRCTSLCESPRPQTLWLCPVAGVRGGVWGGPSWVSLLLGPFAGAGGFVTTMPPLLCWRMSGFGDSPRLWWPLEVMADFWMEPDPKNILCGEHRFAPASSGSWMLSDGWVGCSRGWVQWTGVLNPSPFSPQLTNKPGKPGAPSSKCSMRSVCARPRRQPPVASPSPCCWSAAHRAPCPPWPGGPVPPPGSRPPTSPSPEGSGCLPGASPRREPAQPRRVPSGR